MHRTRSWRCRPRRRTKELIPADQPIRRIRVVVDAVLADLDDVLDGMYAAGGRRSVPPETLLKATVLMALYSIRSEPAFCERLNCDLLFKWFPGHAHRPGGVRMRPPSPGTARAPRARDGRRVLRRCRAPGQAAPLHLRRPFSVDGTLLHDNPAPRVGVAQEPQARAAAPHIRRRAATSRSNGPARSDPTRPASRPPTRRHAVSQVPQHRRQAVLQVVLTEHRHALIVAAELTTRRRAPRG